MASVISLFRFLKDFIKNDNHNINESDEDGTTCLHIAAGLDDETILEYFLKHGAYIDSVSSDGLTPLHIAAIWGKRENVNILLNNGAFIHSLKECWHRKTMMVALLKCMLQWVK